MSKSIRLGKGFSYRLHHGTYRLRVYDASKDPKERTISLNTDHPALAARRAEDFYNRYVTGRWSPWKDAKPFVSIAEAKEAYRRARAGDISDQTIYDVLWTVSQVAPEDTGMDGITADDVRAFIQQRHLSLATRGSYYRKLSAFFRWCIDNRLMSDNPLDGIRRPKDYKPLPDGLTGPELLRLLTAVEFHHWTNPYIPGHAFNQTNPLWCRHAFELIAWTGLRPSEAARLRWDDVGRSIRIRKSKTNRHRSVTIVPQAAEVISRLPRISDHVLARADSTAPISVGYLSKRFTFFRRLAGLPDRYTLYSLRHTFAAEYRRRGGSLSGLQHELGHESIKTTEKYGHLGEDENRKYTLKVFSK